MPAWLLRFNASCRAYIQSRQAASARPLKLPPLNARRCLSSFTPRKFAAELCQGIVNPGNGLVVPLVQGSEKPIWTWFVPRCRGIDINEEYLQALHLDRYTPQKGAHIRVECSLPGYFKYFHHGIDNGDGTVFHFAGPAKPSDSNVPAVKRTTLAQFARYGQPIHIVQHALPQPPDVVVARAQRLLGSCGYHLLFNNCEHFATYCATGCSVSRQVGMRLKAMARLVARDIMLRDRNAIAQSVRCAASGMHVARVRITKQSLAQSAMRQPGGLLIRAVVHLPKHASRVLQPPPKVDDETEPCAWRMCMPRLCLSHAAALQPSLL